ncbi:unnamed protein product, partial [Symbiodinium microadriaticum]
TFYAKTTATRNTGFLCPLGTGAVDFQALHDFGCLACKPGDTQVLNVTSRPAVSNGSVLARRGGRCDLGFAVQP